MNRSFKIISICGALAVPSSYAFDLHHTPAGTEYGLVKGEAGKPLVLVFTTDAKESMDGTFTSIGKSLAKAKYSVASIDVTCHGKDVQRNETSGLACWAARVKMAGPDIFTPMVRRASEVISDIAAHKLASTSSVIAVGVSRGGYAALKLAAADPRVDHLVLMAPVTDLARLSEFANVPVDPAMYGFREAYKRFSSDHIFLQIGNADDRVGTENALAFARSVVLAGRNRLVDLTTVITPLKGHGTARHDMAANWVIAETSGARDKIKKAP
jgi:pimeloyl-ACP methyl ester carboxylesterase